MFQSFGILVWADYGTLLGAVRNPLTTPANYPWLKMTDAPITPGIIPHDKDADFGMAGASYEQLTEVRAKLIAMGYNILLRPRGRSLKVRLSATNKTNADFFLWNSQPNGTYRRLKYNHVDDFKGRDFPCSWIEPMGSVEWEGMTLPAPNDPEAFCAFRYGPKWMTPVKANNDGIRRR